MPSVNSFLTNIQDKLQDKKFSEILWVAVGQAVIVIYGFASVKILTRMGSDEYGKFVLITTIAVLLSMIFYGPFAQGFIRFYYDFLKKGVLYNYVKYSYKSILAVSVVLLSLSAVAAAIVSLVAGFEILLFVILAGIYILSIKLNEFLNSHLNIIRLRKFNSVLQGSEKLLSIGFLLYFYYTNLLSIKLVLIILTLFSILFICIKSVLLARFVTIAKKEISDDKNLYHSIRRSLMNYITPFLIWGSAGWLQLNGEKWIIANYLSTSDLGVYGVMASLVNAFIVIPNNIMSDFATPIIYESFSDFKDKVKIKQGMRLINLISAVCLLVMIASSAITYFFGKELIIVISDNNFIKYSYLLPLFAFGTGLFYLGQAECLVGMAMNKPKIYLLPKILAGLVSVLLNILLIRKWGLSGISMSVVLTGLFYSLYIFIINRNHIKAAAIE